MKKTILLILLFGLLTTFSAHSSISKECKNAVNSIFKLVKSVGSELPVKTPKAQKKYKYLNFAQALMLGSFGDNTPFVRVIPTDKCNLKCSYCFQHTKDPFQMTKEQFISYLDKAKKQHVGMMTFLGGEPMIWKHLEFALTSATRENVLTDMTTNGTLLTKESIDRLGRSGLDFLNISVDGVKKNLISQKTSIYEKRELVGYLKEAKEKYGMNYRFNSVIHKGNFDEIKELIEFSKEYDIPITLGFVVPHSSGEEVAGSSVYFSQADTEKLDEIISHIVSKKRAGYKIIDPDEYFEGMHKFLRREDFWQCNYPTRFGWVNITPRGGIRSCTKKMDELPGMSFLSLDKMKLKELKSTLKTMVSKCNKNCYSNCAFDSYFYKTHKYRAIKRLLGLK